MDICWECPQHSFLPFLINLILIFLWETPSPNFTAWGFGGIGPSTCSWVWAIPPPQRFNQSTFLSSSSPLPHCSDLFRERHMTHLEPMRECEFRDLLSFSWVIWYKDVRSGTAAAIYHHWKAWQLWAGCMKPREKANEKAERRRRQSQSLQTPFRAAGSSLPKSGLLLDIPNTNSFILWISFWWLFCHLWLKESPLILYLAHRLVVRFT